MSSGLTLQQRHHTSLLGLQDPSCPSDLPAVNTATIPFPPAPLAHVLLWTTPEPAPPRQVQRLTPVELAERRPQGLCFNCDEIYVRGHLCAQLRFIEADHYDQDNSTTSNTQGPLGGN